MKGKSSKTPLRIVHDMKKLEQLYMSPPRLIDYQENLQKTRTFELNSESFHQAIYPVLFIAQIFALFPVTGISYPSPNDLKFKWISFRVLYCLMYILFALVTFFFETVRIIDGTLNAKNVGK